MLLQGEGRDQPHFSLLITRFSLVSVPFRGKGRDQRILINGEKYRVPVKFPSPFGEKVGINLGLPRIVSLELGYEFPSPCGEKVGINLGYEKDPAVVQAAVSVPLRGKGRDQRPSDSRLQGSGRVSVPLRGKGRDQPQ